jgi:uncharacterized protein YigE (DUF2233 family)
MKPNFLFLLVACLIFFTSPVKGEEKFSSNSLPWQTLSSGLQFCRLEVLSPNNPQNILTILRLEMNLWSARVFFDREPRTIKEWQQKTGASVICNGGFYREDYEPAGRIISNGLFLGPAKNRHMKGMFLSEPKRGFENLPKTVLIDLKDDQSAELITAYEQGIQSFPILLDSKGQVRVNPSSFQANRTALAQDEKGYLYILVTEKPYFTLYDFGHYLKSLPLGLRFVLNLDGGSRTQLAVQFKAFRYSFSGLESKSDTTRLFFPQPQKLPSVIGFFPRGNS